MEEREMERKAASQMLMASQDSSQVTDANMAWDTGDGYWLFGFYFCFAAKIA